MTRSALTVLALLSFACDPKGGQPPEAPVPPDAVVLPADPAAAARTPSFALRDARIFEVDEPDNALIIASDGSLMLGGETVATLSGQGTITLPSGKVVLEVKGDGSVLINGETSGLTLTADGGTLVTGEKTVVVAFEAGGIVAIDPPPENAGLTMGHEGCEGDMARTCMLVMYLLLTPEAPPGTSDDLDLGEPPEAIVKHPDRPPAR